MRAITVRQPWADLMFRAVNPKTVENRTWATSYRGPLAIVASLKEDKTAALTLPRGHRFGCIIGVVDLIDVHTQFTANCICEPENIGGWARSLPLTSVRLMQHWVLANPRALAGIFPYTGFLGIRDLGTDIDLALTLAVSA